MLSYVENLKILEKNSVETGSRLKLHRILCWTPLHDNLLTNVILVDWNE